MEEFDNKESKVEAIGRHFSFLIGERLTSFETAEIKQENEWDDWFDLPIRLHFANVHLVSVAWSHFDKLFISNDMSLNFPIYDSRIRWVSNKIPDLKPALLGTLNSVQLFTSNYLAINDQPIDLWNRLVLEIDGGWFEIFNGLDENAFCFHREKPIGDFVRCC